MSDLGWQDWIIQPSSFTLYYCKGSCSQTSMRAAVEGGNTYEALLQVKTATASLSLFNIIFCDVCEYCLIYAWRGWRGDT